MRHFILAKDHPRTPKKTALIRGPETDDAKVILEFHTIRAESVHPDGWPVLELWDANGCSAVSVARWKTKADKVASDNQSNNKEKGKQ